jgi:Leucine-rich repeat (LRR) protein
LKKIPEEVFECVGLIYLNISHNEITKIPDDMVKLKFLECFWANSNNINFITPRIKDMKNLQEIDFENNPVPVRFQNYVIMFKERLTDISSYYENLRCALHLLWCAKQLKGVLPMDVWKLIARQILT